MAAIRGKNTKPEMLIRKALHREGFRFRLHRRDLPGKPDLVFPGRKAALFINGCFWHGHDCSLFRWPSTRIEFWREKINATIERDRRNTALLQGMGWRVGTVWECALKGINAPGTDETVSRLSYWLRSESFSIDLRGSDSDRNSHASSPGHGTQPADQVLCKETGSE